MNRDTVDVLIVGAGISGIAAAYYLGARCPQLSWTIVEGRDALGGTWDFFRYPGLRSDSDMFTLGYRFRPWRGEDAIADGASILEYLKDTAREFGIDRRIRFGCRVSRVAWSSGEARWTVDIERGGDKAQICCNFLFMCTGYYRYDQGYTPEWTGMADFAGTVVHPQDWRARKDNTDNTDSADSAAPDYAGKRVIVIGSGATAVTIAPALARKAKHVTMLQRSPSYVVSMPARDNQVNQLRGRLPDRLVSWLARWKMILFGIYYYRKARVNPGETRDMILQGIRGIMGPGFDVERHFGPAYKPWDQRVCVAPDADLFRAINAGKVSMVTDHIERFVEEGLQLRSGEILPADIIVTATGMRMKIMDGVEIIVDGQNVQLGATQSYKGLMYSDIPNLASAFGYTNASWTLKCELICEYVCRLLNYMDRRGYQQCVPRPDAESPASEPMIDFTSGYVQRARDALPKQGAQPPWRVYQNYLKDLLVLRFGQLDDGVMEFRRLRR